MVQFTTKNKKETLPKIEWYNWKEKVIIPLKTESDIHFETNISA